MKKITKICTLAILSLIFIINTSACKGKNPPVEPLYIAPEVTSSTNNTSPQKNSTDTPATTQGNATNTSGKASKPSNSPGQTTTPASQPDTTPPKSGEKALTFDDTVLEALLRMYTKKPSGDIYPSDFNKILSSTVTFQYQASDNNTYLSTNNENDGCASTTGFIKSYNGLSNLPFKKINLSFNTPMNKTYEVDISPFTASGALESIRFPGNGQEQYKQHIRNFNLKNFSSISKCSNLTVLRLQDCTGVDLSAAAGLKNLNYVELKNCGINNVDGLKNASKLSYLEIAYDPITDLSPIAGNSSLETIILMDLTHVDVATLLTLPKLKRLDLSDCTLITWAEYLSLINKGVEVNFYKDGCRYSPDLS